MNEAGHKRKKFFKNLMRSIKQFWFDWFGGILSKKYKNWIEFSLVLIVLPLYYGWFGLVSWGILWFISSAIREFIVFDVNGFIHYCGNLILIITMIICVHVAFLEYSRIFADDEKN